MAFRAHLFVRKSFHARMFSTDLEGHAPSWPCTVLQLEGHPPSCLRMRAISHIPAPLPWSATLRRGRASRANYALIGGPRSVVAVYCASTGATVLCRNWRATLRRGRVPGDCGRDRSASPHLVSACPFITPIWLRPRAALCFSCHRFCPLYSRPAATSINIGLHFEGFAAYTSIATSSLYGLNLRSSARWRVVRETCRFAQVPRGCCWQKSLTPHLESVH